MRLTELLLSNNLPSTCRNAVFGLYQCTLQAQSLFAMGGFLFLQFLYHASPIILLCIIHHVNSDIILLLFNSQTQYLNINSKIIHIKSGKFKSQNCKLSDFLRVVTHLFPKKCVVSTSIQSNFTPDRSVTNVGQMCR